MKTIKCSEKATQMHSTFGAWMLDASQLDDSRYWLAEHFSGDFFFYSDQQLAIQQGDLCVI